MKETRSLALLSALFLLFITFGAALPQPKQTSAPYFDTGSLEARSTTLQIKVQVDAVDKLLRQIVIAKPFCKAALNGKKPGTETVSRTSTTTKTTTIRPKTTETVTTVDYETSTITDAVTETTAVIATQDVIETLTTYNTESFTTTLTETNTKYPDRRAVQTGEAARRGLFNQGQLLKAVEGYPKAVIQQACLLYLYGTLEYTTTAVNRKTKTATKSARTSTVTDTATVTEVDYVTTDITDFVTLATQTEVATISTDYVTATSIIIAATSTQVVSGVFVAHDDSEVYLDVDNDSDFTFSMGSASNLRLQLVSEADTSTSTGILSWPDNGVITVNLDDGSLRVTPFGNTEPDSGSDFITCTIASQKALSCTASNNQDYDTFYNCNGDAYFSNTNPEDGSFDFFDGPSGCTAVSGLVFASTD